MKQNSHIDSHKLKEYNFLKDPHLTYFLQSPYKISQLLRTKRYMLNGTKLVQIENNEEFQIDPYVLKRIDIQQTEKMLTYSKYEGQKTQNIREMSQNQDNDSQTSKCSSNDGNVDKLKSAKHEDTDLKSKSWEFRKLRSQYSYSRVQNKEKGKKTTANRKKESSKTLPFIKGLRQFKKKIL